MRAGKVEIVLTQDKLFEQIPERVVGLELKLELVAKLELSNLVLVEGGAWCFFVDDFCRLQSVKIVRVKANLIAFVSPCEIGVGLFLLLEFTRTYIWLTLTEIFAYDRIFLYGRYDYPMRFGLRFRTGQ